MPSLPLIRAAVPADAPAISVLLTELGFPATAKEITARLSVFGPTPADLSVVRSMALIAELRGLPCALATLHITPVLHRPTPVGRITALVVARNSRRQGIGRALVTESERWLADAGCALVEITSNHSLIEAHAFYQSLGYTITSYRFCKPLRTGSGR